MNDLLVAHCTHICFDEIGAVGDEVLLAAVVRVPVRRRPLPPLLDADEVLDRVEAPLEARRRKEVLHRHPLPQVERHHLKKEQE